MPTSSPLHITPTPGFFPGALTMISASRAPRFRVMGWGDLDGIWNNTSKILSSAGTACGGLLIGLPIHVWKYPGPLEGWGIVTDCVDFTFHVPALDLADGSAYLFTIGKDPDLTLHTLHHALSDFYATTKAYAIRYAHLWTTCEPQFLLHDYEAMHFNGWVD